MSNALMKKYEKIIPEVIVGIGDNTEYYPTEFIEGQKRVITKLHIQLEDWLGDDLMEIYPCYIVTQQLKEALENNSFIGFTFAEIEVTEDEYFEDNYQLKKPRPDFFWIKIAGIKGQDDLYINEGALNISENLLKFIKDNFIITYAKINPERDEFDDLLAQMIKDSKKKE